MFHKHNFSALAKEKPPAVQHERKLPASTNHFSPNLPEFCEVNPTLTD